MSLKLSLTISLMSCTSALADGSAPPVSPPASCDASFATCVTTPLTDGICALSQTSPFCIGLRVDRDLFCLDRYEICRALRPEE